MFREIRRKDRVWETSEAVQLLERGEYGFLSMVRVEGGGYGLPISYVKEGDRLYFHCAPEGYKLDCLQKNASVCFCVVGATKVIPNQFTTAYESVLAFGKMDLNLPEEEKRHALRLLTNKYCPDFKEIGEKYIDGSFHRTNVLRMDIEHISGKSKRIK